jgi:gliding motility-associated-like protein
LAFDTEYAIEYVYSETVYTLNLNSDSLGLITLNGLESGEYRDILVSGKDYTCIDGLELISLMPETTSIGVSVRNPSTCNASNGSLYIEGLLPDQSFELSYKTAGKESVKSFTSDHNGALLVTGLSTGYYTDVTLETNMYNCRQTLQPFELNCATEFLGCFKTKKYFTPNNDGSNDVWHLETLNDCDYTLYIYDKYGKLLEVLTPASPNWDGRYHGRLMPSSDYWYKVDYTDGTEMQSFKAHFTLKR